MNHNASKSIDSSNFNLKGPKPPSRMNNFLDTSKVVEEDDEYSHDYKDDFDQSVLLPDDDGNALTFSLI